MDQSSTSSCAFETSRLQVGPWRDLAAQRGVDLERSIMAILTPTTTAALPPDWQGRYSAGRAQAWIAERDAESPTLLIIDRSSSQPLGFVILFESSTDASLDLRIGYVLAESAWGSGFATELVNGLVEWCRTQPPITTLSGGVARTNEASARVLEKTGFEAVGESDDGEVLYRLEVAHRTEWDQYADGWDDDEAARAYAAAAFDSLERVLDSEAMQLDSMAVCDFGAGTGLLTERLADHVARVDAVDTSTEMLAVLDAKTESHGWDHVTTATALPATPGAYDLIVCSSVCSFLDDYPETVKVLAALLRPGGMFVQWDWERDDTDPKPHGFVATEVEAALSSAGLVSVSVGIGFEVPFGDQVMRPLMGHGRRPTG